MKKILLLTSIYPHNINNKGTKVCHYFASEWVNLGYSVRVIHFQSVFPKLLYLLVKMCPAWIASRTGAVIYTSQDKGADFVKDGVKVSRIPVKKLLPHGRFLSISLNRAFDKVLQLLNSEQFVPDYIVAHFTNPQLEMISKLKSYYPNASSCLVFHTEADISQLRKVYGKKFKHYISSVDVLGFRYKFLKTQFENIYGPQNSFICYSGIPQNYLSDMTYRSFEKPLSRFIFVGELIERKFPIKIMDALYAVYPKKNFHLNYVGAGQQQMLINKRIEQLGLHNSISIIGKVPRNEIISYYDASECFIMISKGEAYGLVYLEAMARGCITIASKREGFDGVIVDGVNGFLCESGDSTQLSNIIERINSMSQGERIQISKNARETAMRLTDTLAAKYYIENVINLGKRLT